VSHVLDVVRDWRRRTTLILKLPPLLLCRQRAHLLAVAIRPATRETKHASVRPLAGPLLTIRSKRNSAALSHGFRSVAHAAVSPALPLSAGWGSRGVGKSRRRAAARKRVHDRGSEFSLLFAKSRSKRGAR
jgi:hypothetical protein